MACQVFLTLPVTFYSLLSTKQPDSTSHQNVHQILSLLGSNMEMATLGPSDGPQIPTRWGLGPHNTSTFSDLFSYFSPLTHPNLATIPSLKSLSHNSSALVFGPLSTGCSTWKALSWDILRTALLTSSSVCLNVSPWGLPWPSFKKVNSTLTLIFSIALLPSHIL